MSRRGALAGCALILIAGLFGGDGFAAAPPVVCGTILWQPIVRAAAHRFALPRAWLDAVILEESAGCARIDGKPTVSVAGAMGLMQLMPATWAEYRSRLRLGDDPFDPRDNIMAGAAYLHALYERYGKEGFLAAYQAGPGRYQEFIRDGRPLPRATIKYVARVEQAIARIEAKASPVPLPAAPAASPLFVVLTSRSANANRTTQLQFDARLFAPLSPVRRSARVSRQ